MSGAYYNENDPKAAAWLRELIARGLIAAGEVDERSIEDVKPNDVRGFTQCHWFAGIGGWSLALRIAGWPDSRPVWTGSCPCQPFSAAGKGAGFADERHLWPAWFHLIAQCRPAIVFGEQVASTGGLSWLDLVQADMEGQGYAVGHVDLCAAGLGAFIRRPRIFFVADADSNAHRAKSNIASEARQPAPRWNNAGRRSPIALPAVEFVVGADSICRPCEPGTRPMADALPASLDLLRPFGNAIVPEVAAAFIEVAIDCGIGANQIELSEAA